jgi:hypothetical protein
MAAPLLVLIVGACGTTGPTATAGTPQAAVSSAASPSASASARAVFTPSPTQAPTPTAPAGSSQSDLRLVIQDYTKNEVRLARLDAVDTARVPGFYDGVVGGQVIVVNGTALETLSRAGSIRKLGTLAATPNDTTPGTVAVKPDLTQWVYTVLDPTGLTSHIHLGSPTSDRVLVTIPSPDGYSFYQPYGWNSTGPYLVKQATGLGGVGPFLEYHFPLVKLDVATGHTTDVNPVCYAYGLLIDGGMVCRASGTDSHVQVRTQSGLTLTIQVSLGTTVSSSMFGRVHISADNSKLIVSRNATTGSAINFQMAVAGLTESTMTVFGPIDFIPDTWLPDGRVVASHMCWPAELGGGSCNASLDGTYVLSADGKSRTLFYKLVNSAVVGYV